MSIIKHKLKLDIPSIDAQLAQIIFAPKKPKTVRSQRKHKKRGAA